MYYSSPFIRRYGKEKNDSDSEQISSCQGLGYKRNECLHSNKAGLCPDHGNGHMNL